MTLLALAVRGRGLVDPNAPILHADDLGFLRGQAAFETIRVNGGRPFDLAAHLDRLDASAARLDLPPVPRDELSALARLAVEAAAEPDCVLRITWSGGRDGAHEATVVAQVSALPAGVEDLRARGITACALQVSVDARAVSATRWLLGGVKSTSYAVNLAAQREARRRGVDEAVLIASDGTVLEGPTFNVWWREGRVLRTPGLDLGILAGVTRSHVMELARAAGYAVEEGGFPLRQMADADEAFTSSSVRELLPIVQLDGRALGDGRPGAAATEFQAALRREYSRQA